PPAALALLSIPLLFCRRLRALVGHRKRRRLLGAPHVLGWLPCVLIPAAEPERWTAQAVAALLCCDGLDEGAECDSDVPASGLRPGHVDRIALAVHDPSVVFPAEAAKSEPLGVAQTWPAAGNMQRIPEACLVTHLSEPFRSADRNVFLTAFRNCG